VVSGWLRLFTIYIFITPGMSRIKRHRTTRTYIHTTSDTATALQTPDRGAADGRAPGGLARTAYGVRDTGYGYVIRLNVRSRVRMYYLSGNPNFRVTVDPRIRIRVSGKPKTE
jgi:hypothetical protein